MMAYPWYRSFPHPTEIAEKNLENTPHIVDNLPKLLMSGQDYKTVSDYRSLGTEDGWPDTNFCLLEWDVALDLQGRRTFAALATIEPREVLVAPYRWHDSWIDFVGNDGRGPTPDSRPVNTTDERTDSFGLGCIYIPRAILSEFLAGMDSLGFTDYTFGHWYHQRYGPARLTWAVHPQHLNDYDTEP